MKVALITRHAVTNYGSLLQTYATQNVIEKIGKACVVIDYVREDENYKKLEKTILKNKPQWNGNLLKRILYLMIRQPESILAGKKFEKMQRKCLNLTRRYDSLDDLRNDVPEADVYMTGSDQVWGPVADGAYDESYCLEFVSDKKKVSYASSFGRTELTSQQKNKFAMYLGQYANVSVRENSAVEMLSKMGIKTKQVLDPTLLMDATEWEEYLEKISIGKYVLVYQLHNDKMLSQYAEKVAQKLELPLVRISASLHQMFRSGRFVYLPDMGEFLSYIKNAEYMITDSFHGTAFAINFNTPFVEVLPNNGTGTRNVSILEKTRLTNRILKNDNDLSIIEEKIDFSYANEVIKKEREESINFLKKILEEDGR